MADLQRERSEISRWRFCTAPIDDWGDRKITDRRGSYLAALHAFQSYKMSYSARPAQLLGFFEGHFTLLVDIGGKIDEVHTACGFLTLLDSDYR
jgi:hypothetical protein